MAGDKTMKIWNDDEVRNLFAVVEEYKSDNQPLRSAFVLHAKKYKRKPNSVRNYYYKEVENLKNDKKRCKNLQIALEKHAKNHFVPFSEGEVDKLLADIDRLVSNGMSVRNACQKLSGGDLTLMTRLQNKYQNLKKRKMADNVIVFKQRQKQLTESDINSLFMGLVKLIKKTAVDEFMEKTRLEKESSAYLLKKAFVDLSRKDKQISELREEFVALKNENKALQEKLENISGDKTELLKSHIQKRRRVVLEEKLK